jgi:hypothetical protein
MKKLFIALLVTLSALPAFAQYNPYPSSCQVVAVDRYNRVVARFYAQTDWRNGQCVDGLRQCNQEIRRRGWYDVRCAQVRNRW